MTRHAPDLKAATILGGVATDQRHDSAHKHVTGQAVYIDDMPEPAGTLHTPGLLMRSGVTNPNVGRHLRLHPTSFVYGAYAEPIEPWTGAPIWSYSTQWADLDGAHYGVMVEHPPAHPGFMGLGLPWRSGR